ncbi:hypothetical protein EDD18DRAFT_1354115 [Armillaria luteobubalina]|uniref:Uncharacterized protein n=1 Tax=Armillaria luteobubalina TaxID=153913 RepID=A0AA39Q5K2_9AGAR|nr:hypothetical protein EDD18DRAFT_1354115 [Armillaria luteobubalina]
MALSHIKENHDTSAVLTVAHKFPPAHHFFIKMGYLAGEDHKKEIDTAVQAQAGSVNSTDGALVPSADGVMEDVPGIAHIEEVCKLAPDSEVKILPAEEPVQVDLLKRKSSIASLLSSLQVKCQQQD